MRNRTRLFYLISVGVVLIFAGILCAQSPPGRALIVNGKDSGTVVQMSGRSYVDLETVIQFTNASVMIEPDKILLTLPVPTPSPSSGASAASQPPPLPPDMLSKDFARLAIAVLAEMREWRGAVGTILMYGVPVVGTWPQDYRDRTDADLNQVAVSATTPGDHDAMQLLQKQFGNLENWANSVVGTRQSLDATKTVNPDVMQNDQALAKISTCNRFLSSMLVSGSFADDPSCH
jgi:hypothetical protein